MTETKDASAVRLSATLHVDSTAEVLVHDSASGGDGVALWFGPVLILGSLRDVGRMVDDAAVKLAALSLEHAAREDAA